MAEKQIVVCDDDEIVYLSVKSIMEKMGYQVHEAHDGKTALALAAQHLPVVIFQDIQMPGIDGFEVCRRIKSDKSLRHIVLIFVSAMEFEAAVEECLRVGADYFVSKPFAPNDLAADLYFLAAADFKPDYPSLSKLRVARSLAVESQRRRSKAVQVPSGEGITSPADLQARPAAGVAQLSRQVAGLVKRVALLESLLREKKILTEQESARLSTTAGDEDKKGDVSWEG